MKSKLHSWKRKIVLCASAVLVLTALSFAQAHKTVHLAASQNAKVVGTILSRDGDLMRVLDKRSGEIFVVNIKDDTKIERKENHATFFRHTDMDVTAMMPGLTIEAEGQGNSKGQLDASKIVFTPDAVDQANAVAQAAGDLAAGDAAAAAMLNQRVSASDDYKNEFEVDVFFGRDSAVLDKTAIKDLANLADIAKGLNGYLIEIAGYSSNTLSPDVDRKLSEERAAAVAHYFLEVKGIPMRRMLVPVGYGREQPVASNSDPQGRELNRRVDIKVLVNKGVGQGL